MSTIAFMAGVFAGVLACWRVERWVFDWAEQKRAERMRRKRFNVVNSFVGSVDVYFDMDRDLTAAEFIRVILEGGRKNATELPDLQRWDMKRGNYKVELTWQMKCHQVKGKEQGHG